MTDKEILKKAVEKAELNGYVFIYWNILNGLKYEYCSKIIECESYINGGICDNGAPIDEMSEYFSVKEVIFSHEFAKAFFGEEPCQLKQTHKIQGMPIEKLVNGESVPTDIEEIWMVIELPAWKHYLQKMVLEENPLKYLERFLNENCD